MRPTTSLYEPVTLKASAAVTADGSGSAFTLPPCNAIAFILDLTDAKTDAADTLDVYIQACLDNVNWVDIVHFTQIAGNGSDTLRYYAKVSADAAQAMFENGTALGAAAVRNLIGQQLRARWDVTADADDPADHTFTFSVTAVPM